MVFLGGRDEFTSEWADVANGLNYTTLRLGSGTTSVRLAPDQQYTLQQVPATFAIWIVFVAQNANDIDLCLGFGYSELTDLFFE